jgi:hypothetical protein
MERSDGLVRRLLAGAGVTEAELAERLVMVKQELLGNHDVSLQENRASKNSGYQDLLDQASQLG